MACTHDLFPHVAETTGAPVIVGSEPLADDDLDTYADITATTGDTVNNLLDVLPADIAPEVIDATFNVVATVTDPGGSVAQPLLMHNDNGYFIALHTFGSHHVLPSGSAVLTQFHVTADHLALEGLTPADLGNVLSEPARLILRGDESYPGPTFRVHRAWLTVGYNCDDAPTIFGIPALRQLQRGDGLGMSGAPRAVQNRSQQVSLRQFGFQ